MDHYKQQRGLSLVSILFFIIVFGFALLFIASTLPSYINNSAVVASMKQVADEPNIKDMSLADFRSRLTKALSLNSVNDDAKKALVIKRNTNGKKGFVATINYEVRENLFLHIDLVSRYDNQLDTSAPELCCVPQAQ